MSKNGDAYRAEHKRLAEALQEEIAALAPNASTLLRKVLEERLVQEQGEAEAIYHERGCGTLARGCVPGCDPWDPEERS
jgi:hypothetical protein